MPRLVRLAILTVLLTTFGCAGGGGDPVDEGETGTAPQGTTLESTIGPVGSRYSKLTSQAPWKIVVRQELAAAQSGRKTRRKPIASFMQFTDMHLMDPQSPARPQYLQKYINEPLVGSQFLDIHRPQELLGAFVSEAMVQRVNELRVGPITGVPFSLLVSTGDNGDFRQKNELQNYINVLDGTEVITDTSGQGYYGVQDTYVSPQAPEMYGVFYHPDPPPAGTSPDNFKTKYGFPEFPGMLQDATKNFTATGLNIPWYTGFGNHDGEQYGTIRTSSSFYSWLSQFATGTLPGQENKMLVSIPASIPFVEFLACFGLGDISCLNKAVTEGATRIVPANPNRGIFSSQEFIQMHLASPASPGPVGHGYTQQNVTNNQWYYAFDVADGVLGLMLDTVDQGGGVNGSIGDNQLKWIEQQIQSVSSKYFDASGTAIQTGNPNKLVVLFSHHNLITMGNFIPDPYDPVRHLASKIVETLQRYPNVILWVNGHSHFNRVWGHPDESAQTGGFWEVNTASHIDFPQQSRSIEIVDNMDGTLSIFGVLIDHQSPANAPNTGPFTATDLASISRELAANDPAHQIPVQIGVPSDRNVELLINKPF